MTEKTLNEYQQSSINRIVNKCKDQKGIIFFHEMGSGKTRTALHVLYHNYYKHFDKILFCDQQLVNEVWKKEVDKINLNNVDEKNIESIHKTYEDYLSVASITNSKNNKNQGLDFVNKVIVVDEAHNLAKLIRKKINNHEKINYDYLIKRTQECHKIIFLTGTPIYESLQDLAILIGLVSGNTNHAPIDQNKFENKFLRPHEDVVRNYGFLLPYLRAVYNEQIGNYIRRISQYFNMSISDYISNIFFYKIPILIKILSNKSSLEKNKINTFFAIDSFTMTYIFIRLSNYIINNFGNYDFRDFYKFGINTFQITLSLSPFIDYHHPKSLPKKVYTNMYVEYNNDQHRHWIEMFLKVINPEKVNENIERNTAHLDFSLKLDPLLDGRIIGNISFSNNSIIDPPKFIKLLNFIQNKSGRHLIYSNYKKYGVIPLQSFFKKKLNGDIFRTFSNIDDLVWFASDINKDDKRILILQPEHSEGISVSKTDYYHILEPVEHFSKYNQIVGRAVRIDSHLHISSPQDRKVVIVNWICKMPNIFLNNIQNLLAKYQIFRNHSKQNMGIIKFFQSTEFPLYTSDEFLTKKNEKIKFFYEALINTLKNDKIKRCSNVELNMNDFLEQKDTKKIQDYCYDFYLL